MAGNLHRTMHSTHFCIGLIHLTFLSFLCVQYLKEWY